MKAFEALVDGITIRPLSFPRDQASFLAHLGNLYPSIGADVLLGRLASVRNAGWRCIGAFGLEAPETMLGMAGFWIQTRFCYGSYLYVDHFIVDERQRRRGAGQTLWDELETLAAEAGCERIVLDTFVTNSTAQRFWMNRGCNIVGLHFGKPLQG